MHDKSKVFYNIKFFFQYRTESHTTGSGKNRRTRTVHYSAEETYFNSPIILLSPNFNQDLYIEFGEMFLPFKFNLPVNIPTSFEHTYGRTRYSVDATLDIPWSKFLFLINITDDHMHFRIF